VVVVGRREELLVTDEHVKIGDRWQGDKQQQEKSRRR
jgi:hypothetical protein